MIFDPLTIVCAVALVLLGFSLGQFVSLFRTDDVFSLPDCPEYDFTHVIHLTHHKAQDIIKRDGYVLTGFVLTKNKEGREYSKCIVDMSAVRWFDDGMTFFRMMHAPTPEEWKGKGVFE